MKLANTKTIILIVGIAVIALIIILVMMFPSPSHPTPSPSPSAQVIPAEQLQKDFQRLVSPSPISNNDQVIRQKLINSLGGKSGTLKDTNEFHIEYDKAPNSFLVEINSNDATTAKQHAQDWFKQQGLSSTGLCTLPVVFYLNPDVQDYLQANNKQFNPVPDGC